MEFDTHVKMDHFKEYSLAQEKQLQKRKPRRHTPLELAVIVTVYGGIGAAYYHYQASFTWPSSIILAVLFFALFADFLLRNVRIAQTIKLADDGLLLGQHHYIIDESGISASGKDYNMHVNWSLVIDVLETKNVFAIQLDGLSAFLLVKSDVSALEELREFIKQKINKD